MSAKLKNYRFKADDTVIQHKLKEMVLNFGFTATAELLGISGSTISNICRGIGDENRGRKCRFKLSDYFNIPWTEMTTLWTEHNANDYKPIPTAEPQTEQAVKWDDFKTICAEDVQRAARFKEDLNCISSGEDYLLLREEARNLFIDLVHKINEAAQLLEQLSGK